MRDFTPLTGAHSGLSEVQISRSRRTTTSYDLFSKQNQQFRQREDKEGKAILTYGHERKRYAHAKRKSCACPRSFSITPQEASLWINHTPDQRCSVLIWVQPPDGRSPTDTSAS